MHTKEEKYQLYIEKNKQAELGGGLAGQANRHASDDGGART